MKIMGLKQSFCLALIQLKATIVLSVPEELTLCRKYNSINERRRCLTLQIDRFCSYGARFITPVLLYKTFAPLEQIIIRWICYKQVAPAELVNQQQLLSCGLFSRFAFNGSVNWGYY